METCKKQASDYAQTGPGLKPAVATKPAYMAPATGAPSLKVATNSHTRGKDGKSH